MKKPKVIFVILLLTFGFTTQSEGQTISIKQSELIKNQVDSIFKTMVVLAEKLDLDHLSSGVNDSRGAGFITNGKYYAVYASLVENVKSNAQDISKQDISIKEKKITVLSEKIVLLTASGTSKAYINDGREISIDFHWSFVYEKIHNNWKVIQSHQSTVK
jgi:hypothetical protein